MYLWQKEDENSIKGKEEMYLWFKGGKNEYNTQEKRLKGFLQKKKIKKITRLTYNCAHLRSTK